MNTGRNTIGQIVVGLIVRAAPYAQRSPRAQLDVALASAALDQPLEVYFLGPAIGQLSGKQQPQAADLPRGLKGWAALPQMGELKVFADEEALRCLGDGKHDLMVDVEFLDDQHISHRWSECRHLIAL